MHLPAQRLTALQWSISLMLLMATMINYMDRQTLANLSERITTRFELTNQQYGNIESVFGVSFAIGSLVFGFLADRFSVRLLYPGVLVAWSLMGVLTGFAQGFDSLLTCRALLGFFEAGHWPCALVVTHAVLERNDRSFGNSILQSGASLGAILTPLIIRSIVGDSTDPEIWRSPFLIVGAVGFLWAIVWFVIVREHHVATDKIIAPVFELHSWKWLWEFMINPRFWALAIMVISINATWQLIRAWLPKFLQKGRGYSEESALYFNSVYYVATDVGCIAAGILVLYFARRGFNVHRVRLTVYAVCAALASLSLVASFLPQGWLLLGTLLIVGAGALGLFPCYYSFTQELNSTNVGKATGLLSFLGWLIPSPLQKRFGAHVDATGSFDFGIAVVGLFPLLGLLAMLLLWRNDSHEKAPKENI